MSTKASRSAITNGTRHFASSAVDARSAPARRQRDIYNELLESLGGADRLTPHERSIARRAAAVAALCERLEADLASGAATYSADVHLRASGLLLRLHESLGLAAFAPRDNPANDSEPSNLDEYMSRQYGAATVDEAPTPGSDNTRRLRSVPKVSSKASVVNKTSRR